MRLPGRSHSAAFGYENKTNERGERLIWWDRAMVDRLRSLREPGESFSDVILRLAGRDGARHDERAGQVEGTAGLPLVRRA
jgi:hypothetical protein